MKKQNNSIFWYLKYGATLAYLVLITIIGQLLGSFNRSSGLALIACLMMTTAFFLFENKMKFSFHFTIFHFYMLMFSLFALLSSSWAIDTSLTWNKGMDLVELFLFMMLFYIAYGKEQTVAPLLVTVMISGYIIIAYEFMFYGWQNLINLLGSTVRLDSELLSANTLGMIGAYTLVINYYLFLYKNFKIGHLLPMPVIFIILAISGSRKALLIVILGTIMLTMIKNSNSKNFINSIIKFLISLLFLGTALYFILQFPMFSELTERMKGIFNILTGSKIDKSTWERLTLIDLGNEIFRSNPLFGIGIDNPRLLTGSIIGKNVYLHNNFIEILASLGLIGFLFYYWFPVYLIYQFLKYRKSQSGEWAICFTLLIIRLITDSGLVSYYEKDTYFMYMIFYLCIQQLQREKKREIEL